MRRGSHDPACGICRSNAGEAPVAGGVIFENDLWPVRHSPPSYGQVERIIAEYRAVLAKDPPPPTG
jgi:hypothetical protein